MMKNTISADMESETKLELLDLAKDMFIARIHAGNERSFKQIHTQVLKAYQKELYPVTVVLT